MEIREVQDFVFGSDHAEFITWPETYVQYALYGFAFRQALLKEFEVTSDDEAVNALSERHPTRLVSDELKEAFSALRTFVGHELCMDGLPGDVITNLDAAAEVAREAGLIEEFMQIHDGLVNDQATKGVH